MPPELVDEARETLRTLLEEWLPAGAVATQGVLVAYGLMGLCLCFAGHRLLRWVLFFGGLGVGAVAAWVAMAQYQPDADQTVLIGACVGGALVGGILCVALLFVGIFVLGAGFGAAVVQIALWSVGRDIDPRLLVLPAAGAGIAALFLERPLIILMTAVQGSAMIVSSVLALLAGSNLIAYVDDPVAARPTGLAALLGAGGFLLLTIVGIAVQMTWTAKPPEEEKKKGRK